MTHTKDEALNRAQSAISYTILALSNGNDLTYAKACLESALTAIKQALAQQCCAGAFGLHERREHS
jgi:hypothetical protein